LVILFRLKEIDGMIGLLVSCKLTAVLLVLLTAAKCALAEVSVIPVSDCKFRCKKLNTEFEHNQISGLLSLFHCYVRFWELHTFESMVDSSAHSRKHSVSLHLIVRRNKPNCQRRSVTINWTLCMAVSGIIKTSRVF
jgi:hypothetical protein